MLTLWLICVSQFFNICVCGCQFTKLYVGPSAASNARTMFLRGGVNYCSLTHHIISLCLDLLPHSLEIQPALSTNAERESQSSIFSGLCLPCAMFFGTLPPLHTHTAGRKLSSRCSPSFTDSRNSYSRICNQIVPFLAH